MKVHSGANEKNSGHLGTLAVVDLKVIFMAPGCKFAPPCPLPMFDVLSSCDEMRPCGLLKFSRKRSCDRAKWLVFRTCPFPSSSFSTLTIDAPGLPKANARCATDFTRIDKKEAAAFDRKLFECMSVAHIGNISECAITLKLIHCSCGSQNIKITLMEHDRIYVQEPAE